MLKDFVGVDVSEFKEVLAENEILFLQNLNEKQKGIEEELIGVENKKEIIKNKIDEDKKIVKKNTKEYREYIGNTESILESIELVSKNLNEIKNKLKNIEESFVEIYEKYKANLSLEEVKNNIEELKQSINSVKLLEEQVKEDNEKNYLIIDNFAKEFSNGNLELNNANEIFSLNLENLQDNPVLKICEKRVELPYTKREIEDFLREYPEEYKTVQDVITKEFMIHIDVFKKHPIFARFKEAYYLCRTKEMMSIFESFTYAKNIMFKSDINPYIIAAVKSKKQLEDYIKCLEENKLEDYPHFKIIFEVNPLAV